MHTLRHGRKQPDETMRDATLQERNEIKAGTLVMHNSHPCATPLSLVTKQGLSWNTARSQLVSSKRQSWDSKPGQALHELLVEYCGLSCCMHEAVGSMLQHYHPAASAGNEELMAECPCAFCNDARCVVDQTHLVLSFQLVLVTDTFAKPS